MLLFIVKFSLLLSLRLFGKKYSQMLAKQLKMSLLQVFSEMTTQRSGFGQNSCVADKQACVFASCAFNKHSVLKILMINFQTV